MHVSFQSTRPLRGATIPTMAIQNITCNFNPRAPCGARRTGCSPRTLRTPFHSTRPLRGATAPYGLMGDARHISIHAPLAGRDRICNQIDVREHVISIHAPLAGRDARFGFEYAGLWHFNPRAPCGARLRRDVRRARRGLFQSTRPLRGATDFSPMLFRMAPISIHAPLAGRDTPNTGDPEHHVQFQSTRPLRGATFPYWARHRAFNTFQSTRPLRGATIATTRTAARLNISIHAPLAGRDIVLISAFLMLSQISIHAPLAGRDQLARLFTPEQMISIHAPLAGRDCRGPCMLRIAKQFQSTRPLRGATVACTAGIMMFIFQSTRPLRGATRLTL